MKLLLLKFTTAIAIVLLSTSGLKAQTPIGICPDWATFSSMTRGYYFTAPTTFVICGIYVEDDRSVAAQSVEIVRFTAGGPPAYPGTTNNFVSLFYQNNYVPNSMIAVPNIVVNAGDVIGVYGSRGSAINSYGPGPCATTIQGFPVTLYRSGMQANLAVGQMANIWNENSGSIGRVSIYTGCCLPPVMSQIAETCVGSCDGTATATPAAGAVAPFTYQWDAAAANQTTQTATNLCAGTYTVTVTDGNGCSITGTVTVTSGAAAANATITPAGPFCANSTAVNLTAVDPGGTWSGTGITNGTTGTFDPAIAGVGTHTITYMIPGACGDTATTNITVNPVANATINPAGPFCDFEPATNLTAAQAGGTWSGTGITNGVAGTFDPATAGAGTHTITYTIAGPCGDSQTTTITVNSSYDATITQVGPYCELEPDVTLQAVDGGGTWSGTGITNTTTGVFSPSTAGPGTHAITYLIPGACGDTNTINITVNPALDATISPVGPFCTTDPSITMTAVDAGGTWTGTGITNGTTGTFDPATAGAGNHMVYYTIPGTCGDIDSVSIIVSAFQDATITQVGPFCANEPTLTLTAVDPGGVWSGTGITNSTTGTFDPSTAGPGTHAITYLIAGSCGDTNTINIVVNSVDDATITPPGGPFCLGAPSINLITASPGGIWVGNGITNQTTGTFNPTNAGPGIHTIAYASGGPCPDADTITIEVLGPLQIQAFADTTICDGESVTLTATGSGGDGNTTIGWVDQVGNIIGTGGSVVVSPSSTTTYTATIIDGCTTPPMSDAVTVTVNPIPTIEFSVDDADGCAPLTVTFTNNSSPMGNNCLWDFGNGNTMIGCGSVTTTYTQTGCYDVTLTVTANGCSNSFTDPAVACVVDDPIADFSMSPNETTVLNTEVIFDNESINADSYDWDFNDGGSSEETNPTHLFPEVAANYKICLIAYNDEGCSDTICKVLPIEEELIFYIPNSFTPDGDEHNQYFQPIFTQGFEPFDFTFIIFNRWGEVIWESHDVSVGWDGTYQLNGKIAQLGTYVWRVEYQRSNNDERIVQTGSVNIIK